MRQVVLDNEAVQALLVQGHPKKRAVQAHIEGGVGRRQRGARTSVVVPVVVRVESGWDRRSPGAAGINRLRIGDLLMDGKVASEAASIQANEMVGVADAHLGAVVRAIPDGTDVVVLTSDPDDVQRVCGDRTVTIVVV